MKSLARRISLCLVLALTSGAAWTGCSRTHPGEQEGKEGPEKPKEQENGLGVTLDVEKQKRIALRTEPLEETALQPEAAAYGRVIDPSPLIALCSDLTTAESALEASKSAAQRAGSLFQGGENVARKQYETAQAQFLADRARVEALRRKLLLEWGSAITQLDPAARETLLDGLARFSVAYVRADVPAGQHFSELPKTARLVILGQPDEPLQAVEISPATSVDPKTQTQGFLIRVDRPPFPLHPGAAVTTYLQIAGDVRHGVRIPKSAVLYFAGMSWVYVQTAPERFTRRPLGEMTPLTEGLFVEHEFHAGEQVVVAGAQTLLSEEQRPPGGGGD